MAPSPEPKTANLDASATSSNEQGIPVPWWIGPDWRPLHWIVPQVYNWRTEEIRQKVGSGKASKTQTTGYVHYGDVAGIAGLGLVRAVRKIESDNEVIWEGNVTRSDTPGHPDYWRATINTSYGTFYVYWGRPDQPLDDILLGPIGASDPTLAHPNYKYQVLVVAKGYRLGQGGGSVPNTRLLLERVPQPAFGSFPPQAHPQGESIVAGQLELLTHPVFGAGLPLTLFDAAECQGVSAAVMSRVGRHAPFLDRPVPLREAIKDLSFYYDGWWRIHNGRITPGYYPHTGTVPPGLTELSVHDFVSRPDVRASSVSDRVNDMVLVFRNPGNRFQKDYVNGSASDNVEARRSHDSRPIEMLGIVDRDQAAAFVAEAVASGAEGEWEGDVEVRRPKAVWAGGQPLLAGDNFKLDLVGPQIDQVCRILKRVDPYSGPPSLEFVAERGIYPSAYIPPGDERPEPGRVVPLPITHANVYELTADLAGTPIGLPVSFLAKRPGAEHVNAPLGAANVLGFHVWYSKLGASYDRIGTMSGFAVRGTVREAIASGVDDLTVRLTLDSNNLDLYRIASQSASGQEDDTLLVIIGREVFSVGAITIAGLDYDLVCKRKRQGSSPSGHAVSDVAWLVWKDELPPFLHKEFVENQTRYFKLQPFTSSAVLELSECPAITYAFRDRDSERPVVAFNSFALAMMTGRTYFISGQISDVNGDLVGYEVLAAKMAGAVIESSFSLLAGDIPPVDSALFNFRVPVVFPETGTWRILVRAWDAAEGVTEELSNAITVAAGNGLGGPDDGVQPDPITVVTITPGLGALFIDFTLPTNTPIHQVLMYVSETTTRPAVPDVVIPAPMNFHTLTGLPASALRYVWFEVEAKNGRKSTITGPFNGTTRAGINLSDIIPGMTLVEIVPTLPSTGNFNGRTVVLVTDGKLYKWNHPSETTGTAHWGGVVGAVNASDIVGELVNAQIADIAAGKITGQLVDSQIAALAAAKVTGQLSNSQIADLAAAKLTGQITQTQITDGSISTSKIAANAIVAGKIAAEAITANELAANAVSAAKIAANAVEAAKIAAGAVEAAKIAAGAVVADKIAANAVETGKIAAGAVSAAKIAALAVEADKLAANAVTADKIAANAIVAAKIAAGAITADAVGANLIIANTANIADAIITSAKIASLAADKITAGIINVLVRLNAAVLVGAKVASSSVVFNASDPDYEDSEFPAETVLEARQATDADSTNGVCPIIVYGWKTGTGFALDRFGKSNPVFRLSFNGVVDHYVTIWWRSRFSDGSFGSWVCLDDSEAIEPLAGYGQVSTSAIFTPTGEGGFNSFQFAVFGTDKFGNFFDNAKKLVRGKLTVTVSNL